MRTLLAATALLLILSLGLALNLSLHRSNDSLRSEIARLRGSDRSSAAYDHSLARTAAENVAASASERSDDATGAMKSPAAEIASLRSEIAMLERRAAEQYAATSGANSPAVNRDPEHGMAQLENLTNVGQSTPAAAFQTLAWAALKGADDVMAQLIGLDDGARKIVLDVMARLPESERTRFATPEQFTALFLSKAFLNVSAIQIVRTETVDSSNATLVVRGLLGNEQRLPMRLGPAGWQLWEGEAQAKWLQAQLASAGQLGEGK